MIIAIKEDNLLRVLNNSDHPPENIPIELFTRDEIERMLAARAWLSLAPASRDSMLMNTQSHAYSEWMDESDWDLADVLKLPAD